MAAQRRLKGLAWLRCSCRERVLRLGASAWRTLRPLSLHAFTAVAPAIAGAARLGAFEGDPGRPLEQGATPAPASQPAVSPSTRPLLITCYLVCSEERRALLHAVEDQLTYREYLSQAALEVLVVRTPAEEAQALRIIDEARSIYPFTRFAVEDLR
jgi:hypothetical protein